MSLSFGRHKRLDSFQIVIQNMGQQILSVFLVTTILCCVGVAVG